MIRAILSIIFLLLLLLLTPVALWLGVRWLVRKTRLKAYGGWIASFIILLLPALFIYNLLKGRGGDEIYEAVFKGPKPDCVRIISFKDARIPIIDNDIRLHFHTCPQEMRRILKLEEYETDTGLSAFTIPPEEMNTPEFHAMRDSMSVFQRAHGGGASEIFMRLDSTEAYYLDADF